MARRVTRTPLPPRSLAEVLEAIPKLRQSLMGDFDNCRLSALFDLEGYALTTAEQARGIIFHRYAGKVLRTLWETGQVSMPVAEALAIFHEACAQRDVPDRDLVWVPSSERRLLKIAAVMLVWNPVEGAPRPFGVDRLIPDGIELRLDAAVHYPESRPCRRCDGAGEASAVSAGGEDAADGCGFCGGSGRELTGAMVERTISGQLDALLADPAANGMVVLDWKAQPVDAQVLTPQGFRRIGDVAVGDRVIGRDGRPTEVLGVYPQGAKEVFEVMFSDGSNAQCTDEHLWTVRRTGRGSGGGGWQTRTLAAIRADRGTLDGRYWQVPAVDPVEFAPQDDLPLDPYVLGALLGDGHLPLSGSVTLTTADPELLARVGECAPAGTVLHHVDRLSWRFVGDPVRRPNAMRAALADLGLLGCGADTKFVPERYLQASAAERLELLRGLMDADGCISEHNQISFCSASRALAESVRWLVWSLGGRATIKTWPRAGSYHDSHAVYFRLPVVPFRLERKAQRWRPNGLTMNRAIKGAVSVGTQDTVCIRVAASDSLYVTNDFIVTHNTTRKAPPRYEGEHRDEHGRVDASKVDAGLSYLGYWQQRVYGLLVLRNMPDFVQRVTLREVYPLDLNAAGNMEVRTSTIARDDLETIEQELATVAEILDRGLIGGSGSGVWDAQPGVHCRFCRAPSRCPIEPEARGAGRITSRAEAQRVGAEAIVAQQVLDAGKRSLKEWVAVYGPVAAKWAKGRQEWRFKKPKTGNGRGTFGVFVPEASDRGPEDPIVASAFDEVRERKREAMA